MKTELPSLEPMLEHMREQATAARLSDEEDQGDNRSMDPELLAMQRMLRELRKLDEPAKGRAVSWLWKRYSQDSLPGGS